MATLTIRNFPDTLYEELKEKARKERRSLAQQVIYMLQEAVDQEPVSLLELRGLGKELWTGVKGSSEDPQE